MDRLTYEIMHLGYAVDDEEVESFPMETFNVHIGNAINKLADYENAEEQGLLLKLPCKVGDYVYQIDRMLWKIHTRKVSKIELAVTATDSVMTIYFETAGFCYLSHFGKTVFLDKKDALNALDLYSVG